MDAEKRKTEEQTVEDSKEILRRKMSVANLEAKKSSLFIKQSLVDEAYVEAGKRIFADNSTYFALIKSLLANNSQPGEKVIICAEDKDRITPEFIEELNLGLTLSETYGDFRGGVILMTDAYEKNLTLPLLLRQCRERTEGRVVEALFDEEK